MVDSGKETEEISVVSAGKPQSGSKPKRKDRRKAKRKTEQTSIFFGGKPVHGSS